MKKYLLHVVSPLLIGILIYVVWRSPHLYIYIWLGGTITEVVNHIQHSSFIKPIHLPGWVLYSLPDALWLYAMTTLMVFIWHKKITNHSLPWLLLCPSLAFGSEMGQGLQILPGTYDNIDMLAYLVATLGAYAHVFFQNHIFNSHLKIQKYEKEHW